MRDFPDGDGVVSMFFLIRYQTVVASRRLINFARQFFRRVTLVRMTASSIARHFLRAGVFIFPRGIKNHTLRSRSPGREKTCLLIDDFAALLDNRKQLTKWTDDLIDARNWLIRELDAFHGEQYFAGIFDHIEKKSVFKDEREGRLDLVRFRVPGSNT